MSLSDGELTFAPPFIPEDRHDPPFCLGRCVSLLLSAHRRRAAARRAGLSLRQQVLQRRGLCLRAKGPDAELLVRRGAGDLENRRRQGSQPAVRGSNYGCLRAPAPAGPPYNSCEDEYGSGKRSEVLSLQRQAVLRIA